MKKLLLIIASTMLVYQVQAQLSGGGEANPDLPTNKEALAEFRDMRFGMFIHWGPVALRGTEIGWSRGREVPIPEYEALQNEFNPVLFNAAEWVKTAKDAGMKYIIITSRHHDGFCLWDSEFTDYDMAGTPYGKGVLKELSDECIKQGIKFGTYYSICDWHHPDYPAIYPDPDYKFNVERTITDPDMKMQMDSYITFMKNQLNELIDNYNTFCIWFDGEWEWPWTHEMGMEMYAYLRGIKDDILINNRVDKGRVGWGDNFRSAIYAGDFATPEQTIGAFDNESPWETCMTIAEQWAWKPNDKMKSKEECIHTLLQTIGGDGNLLFNVGPMLDGRIEQRQIDRLKEMGEWISANEEAVYGTRGGPYLPTGKMVSTHKGKKIYLYLLKNPEGILRLPLDKKIKIKQAYFLHDGSPLAVSREKEHFSIALPGSLPDETATVIALELDRPASEIEVIERFRY